LELVDHPGQISATSSAPATSGRFVVSRPSPATIPRHSRRKAQKPARARPHMLGNANPYHRVGSKLGGLGGHGGVDSGCKMEVGSVWWSLVAASELALSDKPTRSVETGAPCSITPSLPDLPTRACETVFDRRASTRGLVEMPSFFLWPSTVLPLYPGLDRVPVDTA